MSRQRPEIIDYYGARAREYERVYEKPERQDDLRQLGRIIPAFFEGRRVLDVACGTGYWTRRIASSSSSITGCDLAEEVLAVARERQPPAPPTTFEIGDAFHLGSVAGDFDAAFVGFLWSHLLRSDLDRFVRGLSARLPRHAPVMIVDNRFVADSNHPISRADADGNTYQRRRLDDGSEHEVLKNFPTPGEIRAIIAPIAGSPPEVAELTYYWIATYET